MKPTTEYGTIPTAKPKGYIIITHDMWKGDKEISHSERTVEGDMDLYLTVRERKLSLNKSHISHNIDSNFTDFPDEMWSKESGTVKGCLLQYTFNGITNQTRIAYKLKNSHCQIE